MKILGNFTFLIVAITSVACVISSYSPDPAIITSVKVHNPSLDNTPSVPKEINEFIHYNEYKSAFGLPPKSLNGTSIPIHFKLDEQGNLIITRSIMTLMDYFLSANTEESISTIQNRILEVIDRHLDQPANEQAHHLVHQYFKYKENLSVAFSQFEKDLNTDSTRTPLRLIELRQQLRMASFTPETYEAFFSKQDEADLYKLKKLNITKRQNISDAEKESLLIDLESQFSEELQLKQSQQRFQQRQKLAITNAKKNGLNEEALFQLRSQAYDQETALRFAKADKQQKEWEERYQQYSKLKAEIEESSGLSVSDKKNEIEALRDTHFNSQEKIRVKTLDRISKN